MAAMKRFLPLLLCLLVPLSFCLTGCGNDRPALTYVLSDEPVTLDPQVAVDDNAKQVIGALFEGLTRLDAENRPIPGVAERWEVTEDGTVYTFYLREDAQWEDGVPVTAQDFVYGFLRTLDPATDSPSADSLFCIENARAYHRGKAEAAAVGITAQDTHTLQIRLQYDDGNFLRLCASAPCMPCREDYFLKTAGQYGLESSKIIGNGPFCMQNIYAWEHDSYLHLEASKTYRGGAQTVPSVLNFSIDSTVSARTALETGASCAAMLTQTEAAALPQAHTAAAYANTTWGILFQTQAKAVADADVRRNLLQALDWDALRDAFPADALPAEGIVPPAALFLEQSYREQAGKAALSQWKRTNTAVPPLTILCPDTPEGKAIANAMLTAWNPAFRQYYNMQPLPEDALARKIADGDFTVAVTALSMQSPGPVAFLSRFTADAADNPARYRSKACNDLLTFSEHTTPQTVLQCCRQAEQLLLEDGVFCPLYAAETVCAEADGLTGTAFSPTGTLDFRSTASE